MRMRRLLVGLALASTLFAGLAGGAGAAANPDHANCLGVGFSGMGGTGTTGPLISGTAHFATGAVGQVASLLATTDCGQR